MNKAAECVGIVLNDDPFSNAHSIDVNLFNLHANGASVIAIFVRQETIDANVGYNYNAKTGNTYEPSQLVGGANLLKENQVQDDKQAII